MDPDTKSYTLIGAAIVIGIAGLVLVGFGVSDVQSEADATSGLIKLVTGMILLAIAGVLWLRSQRTPKDDFAPKDNIEKDDRNA